MTTGKHGVWNFVEMNLKHFSGLRSQSFFTEILFVNALSVSACCVLVCKEPSSVPFWFRRVSHLWSW